MLYNLRSRLISTFSNQSSLKRLPIPTLENLRSKYLKSIQPLVSPSQYSQTKTIVDEFTSQDGFGQVLQKRLIKLDESEADSWLEKIWESKAYLEYRGPSMINVNWWCQFKDHPMQKKDLLIKKPPAGVLTSFQIMRAAGLVTNLLNLNDLLNSQTLPPDYIKETPLCMNQFKKIFGTTRIPGPSADILSHQYPTTSQHIIVMLQDQMFKVDVIAQDGRVPLTEIERVLFAVGKEALNKTSAQPDIGILTAGDRDTAYKATAALSALSQSNAKNLSSIYSALFILCLDDRSAIKNLDKSHLQIFHNSCGANRWFDASIQLIVANNGRAGINGEHSACDAVVPGRLMSHIIKNEPAIDPVNMSTLQLPYPQKLEWVIDDEIEGYLTKSRLVAKELILDTESCLLQTDVYGSRFIKEVAATSPDAYIQLVLQLTYFRLFKAVTPVYESTSTRLFKHGRTETGRSMSSESLEFVKSFDNDDILYADKRILYRKAIAAQSGYMKDAAFGRGIDRHMLGLQCMVNADEIEQASMFSDPSFKDSKNFRLSTSNMSPGTEFYGGFGPVVNDGFGVNYAIDKDCLKFSISTKKSCSETSSYKFKDRLKQTLIDMFILFPKRSEVWGIGWEKARLAEGRDDYRLGKMKQLSDDLRERQTKVAERYQKPQ